MGVPSIQMRHSTERPEVYDVKASIKFDPTIEDIDINEVINKVKSLKSNWKNPFGDGNSSEIIVEDLLELSKNQDFKRHKPEDYSFDVSNSFKE